MPVSPSPSMVTYTRPGGQGAEVTEVGARLGRGRREPGVVAPGGHGGHVGAGLALELLPRGAWAAARLPRDHPFQPLVERLEVSGLVGAVAAVPAGLDGHAAAFTGACGHQVLLGSVRRVPEPGQPGRPGSGARR